MIKLITFINKGDLILVTHRDKRVFDGVVGMIAKRDIESQCSPIGSTVGCPQGYGRCIIVNMDDFEALGDFYGLTGVHTSFRQTFAVEHEDLVVPDNCEWIVKDLCVVW